MQKTSNLKGTFTKYSIPACVWGVCKRADGAGYVVVAMRSLADGSFVVARQPRAIAPLAIAPSPVSIHTARHTAEAVAGMKTYGCAGSA